MYNGRVLPERNSNCISQNIVLLPCLYTGMQHPQCLCFIIPLIVVLALTWLITFPLMGRNVSTTVSRNASKAVLGIAGDTIHLDEANNILDTQWFVRECLQKGDYYKISSLYAVLEDHLIFHNSTAAYHSRELFQAQQSRQTGMVNTPGLYLLNGSSINYTICISSESYSKLKGRLYVFDDRSKYYSYIAGTSTGEHASVYWIDLPIGINNHSICSQLVFLVHKAAYYYVAGKTPGGILYNFTAIIHAVYLNNSDYSEQCQISGSDSCSLNIPHDFKKYALLAFIHPVPPYVPEPLTTHLCISRKEWTVNSLFLGALIGALILALICILTFYFYNKCSCNQNYHGYTLTTSSVEFDKYLLTQK